MTEKEIKELKEFWEWCGFIDVQYKPVNSIGKKWLGWLEWQGVGQPPFVVTNGKYPVCLEINLNNLFKWAVPKVLRIGYEIALAITEDLCEVELNDKDFPPKKQSYLGQDKDLAQALYQAIQQVRMEEG